MRVTGMVVAVLAGLVMLGLRVADIGPEWIGGAGSVAVVTGYAWALAARVGGRPVVAFVLAAVLGTLALVEGGDVMRTGAAVLTCLVSGLLAVMATVPAKGFPGAVREVAVALLIASVGAVAVVGFDPVVDRERFDYLTLGLGLAAALVLVFRLGAGLHGLGRRGIVVVVVGSLLMMLTLAYTQLLRTYGTEGMLEAVVTTVSWSREHLGAFPRLIVAAVGVPALLWGVHMRARRRQGWWVCAFGVAGTIPVAQMFTHPAKSYLESVLQSGYGALIGLVIGFALIRLDLMLTGGGGGRRAEEATAIRPEPPRWAAL